MVTQPFYGIFILSWVKETCTNSFFRVASQLMLLSVADELGPSPRRGIAAMMHLGKCDLEGKYPSSKLIRLSSTINILFKAHKSLPIL